MKNDTWRLTELISEISSFILNGGILSITLHIIAITLLPIYLLFGSMYSDFILTKIILWYLRIYGVIMISSITIPLFMFLINSLWNRVIALRKKISRTEKTEKTEKTEPKVGINS